MTCMTITTWINEPANEDDDNDVICEGCEDINPSSFARIVLASGRVVYLCDACAKEIAHRFPAKEHTTP